MRRRSHEDREDGDEDEEEGGCEFTLINCGMCVDDIRNLFLKVMAMMVMMVITDLTSLLSVSFSPTLSFSSCKS